MCTSAKCGERSTASKFYRAVLKVVMVMIEQWSNFVEPLLLCTVAVATVFGGNSEHSNQHVTCGCATWRLWRVFGGLLHFQSFNTYTTQVWSVFKKTFAFFWPTICNTYFWLHCMVKHLYSIMLGWSGSLKTWILFKALRKRTRRATLMVTLPHRSAMWCDATSAFKS